jgi:hypothetical protein
LSPRGGGELEGHSRSNARAHRDASGQEKQRCREKSSQKDGKESGEEGQEGRKEVGEDEGQEI